MRPTSLAVTGLAAAMLGLAAWTAHLHGRLSAPGAPPSPATAPSAARDAETEARLSRIEARLDELAGRAPARPEPAPGGGSGADPAPVPGVHEGDLEAALDGVLRRREERARAEAARRWADRFVMTLDPEVRLDEARRRALVPRIAAFREARVRLFDDPDLDARARETAATALTEGLERELSVDHSRAEVLGILRRLGMVAEGRGRSLEDLPGGAARRAGVDQPPPGGARPPAVSPGDPAAGEDPALRPRR